MPEWQASTSAISRTPFFNGCTSAAANSSCLRVLVIHTDDSMEVVELKDDLGLDVDDIDAIVAKLEAQGVTDIKAVDTHGGV